MLVAITGHSSGLGQALYNSFENTIGFDLTNGYDIKSPQSIIQSVLSNNCDVFINNAYYKFAQVDLLEELFELWRYENKTIVNISSVAPDYPEATYDFMKFYATHKLALDDACRRLQVTSKKCKIINIKPSWIDTPMTEDFDVSNKMSATYVAEEIREIILSKNNLSSITINAKTT